MPNPCEINTDTASAESQTVAKIIHQTFTEGALQSLAVIGFSISLLSSGAASSYITGVPGSIALSEGAASSYVTTQTAGVSVALDGAVATNKIVSALSLSLQSAGAASTYAPLYRSSLLSSTALATNQMTLKTSGVLVLQSSANASSPQATSSAIDSASNASASSYVVSSLMASNTAASSGHATSQAPFRTDADTVLTSTASASSALAAKLTASQIVTEWAEASSGYVMVDSGMAYTCDVETFGMSFLTGAQLNSVAEIAGVLYGITSDGLYAMTGEPGDASIRTGLADLGTQERITYCYVGYEGASGLTLSVGSTGSGAEETYSYELEARTADIATAGRAKLGRGMRTRYARLTVANKTDQPLKLHDLKLVTEQTSRRV